ncbi:hypothetical protein CCP3SC5AM1_400019 [Gammaproteobacteria bacterium]
MIHFESLQSTLAAQLAVSINQIHRSPVPVSPLAQNLLRIRNSVLLGPVNTN